MRRAAWVIAAWVAVAGAAAWGAQPRPVVNLSAQKVSGAESESTVFGGLLCREIERQAVLIAAREELGLRTRDAAAGEVFAGGGTTLSILTHNVRGQRSLVVISPPPAKGQAKTGADRQPATAPAEIGRAEFKIPRTPLADYALFASEAERQSRTDFVELLRKAGATQGQPEQPTAWGAGPVSPDAAANLSRMNPFSQFEAARLLHQQMRNQGASPERMAALAEAYANLGMLTQYLWNADAKVFAARSLLYAERLVVHEKASPATLYIRAYARAMAGLQRLALADLKAAGAADGVAPAWIPAITCWCKEDLDAELAEAAEGRPYRGLATVLAAAIARDSAGPDRVVDVATQGLAVLPESGFLLQTLWHTDVLAVVRPTIDKMVIAAPEETLAGLDRPGIARLHDAADRATGDGDLGLAAARAGAMADLLRKGSAADDGEPSLGMLGQLVSDEAFNGASAELVYWRQRDDMGEKGLDALGAQLAPVWKGNANGDYAEAMLADPGGKGDGVYKALKKWHPRDPGRWMFDSIFIDDDVWRRLGRDDKVNWYGIALASLDLTPLDYSQHVLGAIRATDDVRRMEAAQADSPYSALLFAGMMEHYPADRRREDPTATEKILEQAASRFAGKPRVMAVAGPWAFDANEFARGIGWMEGAMKADPELATALPLVQAYLHVGDVDAARRTADVGLALQDDRMLAPSMAQALAAALLSQGRADDAWFYAKFAADSDAAWGYDIAASCQERLGNLDEAAAWLKRDADLYPQHGALWQLWAARTGHASLPDARAAADAYAKTHPDDAMNGWSALATGDVPAALKAYARDERHYGAQEWAVYSTLAALAHDPRALENGLTHLENSKNAFGVHLAGAARGNQLGFELDQLAVVREADWRNAEASDQLAVTGALLAATGHKRQALPLLKRAVHAGETVNLDYALAWDALKRMGEDPKKVAGDPLPVVKQSDYTGVWQATVGGGAAQAWTLGADGSVTCAKPAKRGGWQVEDGLLVIRFANHDWTVFPAAITSGTAKGDSQKGPGTAEWTRDVLP